jgi:hypothetical protein
MITAMKIAIMQPYFFPYIGYWQLINTVDRFVVFDDVNYINRGWINRNRILSKKLKYYNLPLLGASQNKKINEISVDLNTLYTRRNSRILHETYLKAPFLSEIEPLSEKWLYISSSNLAGYLTEQIAMVCGTLDIRTEILVSSQIDKNNSLKGEDKIIEICRILGATEYVNPIGGTDLYHKEHFEDNGIRLSFIRSDLNEYPQFGDSFVPALSILDILMFCGIEGTKAQLEDYSLLHP